MRTCWNFMLYIQENFCPLSGRSKKRIAKSVERKAKSKKKGKTKGIR